MNNSATAKKIVENIEKVLVGKHDVAEMAVITLLAGGHLLLEDVPGVGKTTLATALSSSIDASFGRIQFTPDTLPSDVTGISVYSPKTGEFSFSQGPIINNIVLADEINRTSPKTQAALLEAMGEGQVTVDGVTYKLPDPFFVIATQNPIEYLGTYNLPEAQLDRFMTRLSVGYPSGDDELDMLKRHMNNEIPEKLGAVCTGDLIPVMQKEVMEVKVCDELMRYAVAIIDKTRELKSVSLGASPRATIALVAAVRACAYVDSRDYVTPDDFKRMLVPVLAHRLILTQSSRMQGKTTDHVLSSMLEHIAVPV